MGNEHEAYELQPDEIHAELRRHNLLFTLMERRVIAEAVAGIEVDKDSFEEARALMYKNKSIGNDVDLQRYLVNQGLSQEDLDFQVALDLRYRVHCDTHYRHKAEAHFLSRKNQLDRVVYSLLRVKDRFLVRELYLRIEAGEANFADLAAQYAEGPEKQTNGIVGPVSLTQAHPTLAELLRTSTPGVLLHPFQISEWWMLMRLEKYTPSTFDDATAQRMTEELFVRWVKEETARRMAKLQSSVAVTSAL